MKVTADFKMVIVLDESLPAGLQCNTSAVLSLTVGQKVEGLIDRDLVDGSGEVHVGITNQTMPILKTSQENLRDIKEKAKQYEHLFLVDFTDAAQTTRNYADYEEKLKAKTKDELVLLGLALVGTKENVTSLTGNLGLLK